MKCSLGDTVTAKPFGRRVTITGRIVNITVMGSTTIQNDVGELTVRHTDVKENHTTGRKVSA